jgi:ubiquinone/menaquinone biosynthesis C-methylase UbiE
MSSFIKDFWESQAKQHKTSPAASWADNFAIDLEIRTIGAYVTKNSTVLDVGCGNGYSAFRQLERDPGSIVGVDYAESMIHYADQARQRHPQGDRIRFEIGDIRKLRFPDASFDLVYTTRVLINLPTWEEQIVGINECVRVTKSGGTVIFSEAFWEPLVLLNALRSLKQLSPLVEHDFNRYLKKEKLEAHLKSLSLEFECVDFSSVYYLGSRFLRELVTNIENDPVYNSSINKIFYELELEYSGGGFGVQQAYVIRR